MNRLSKDIAVSVLKAVTDEVNRPTRWTKNTLRQKVVVDTRGLGIDADVAQRILTVVLDLIFEGDIFAQSETLNINGQYFRFETELVVTPVP